MNEQAIKSTEYGYGITTIRKFAKKYGMPEHLIRSMCKRGEIPGFFQNSRYYVHERLALDKLNNMSTGTVNTETINNGR